MASSSYRCRPPSTWMRRAGRDSPACVAQARSRRRRPRRCRSRLSGVEAAILALKSALRPGTKPVSTTPGETARTRISGCQRPGERLGHHVDAGLGGAVGDGGADAGEGGDRRDIDTTSPSPEALSSGAKARIGGELAAPVDGEHAVDQLVVQRVEIGMRHRLGEARRVDQDVEPAVALLDRRRAGRSATDVSATSAGKAEWPEPGRAVDQAGRLIGGFGTVEVRYGDPGAGLGQHPGCGGADAAGSTDDERNFPFEGNRVSHGEVLSLKKGGISRRRRLRPGRSASSARSRPSGGCRGRRGRLSGGTGSVPRSAKRSTTLGSFKAA